jgi:putative redox protein
VDTLEIRVTAEQAETHPQVFTAIHLEFVLTGDTIRLADVERAIELSETKYCAVHAMLNGTVDMTHSVRLEAAAAAELAVSH